MSDPFNDGGDTVGHDDGLEEGVDTGGINIGQTAGGAVWGQGDTTGDVDTGGRRGDLPSDDDFEDLGVGRLTLEEQAEQREQNAILQAEEDAYMEELARLEAEKNAAREEAHANGEAFKEGDTTWNGEPVEEWTLPDGTVILVNEDGDAVSVQWPPGEGPVYIGDVLVGGEPHAVYELPTGTQIVVNEDGDTIGTLDDVDVDDMSVPMYWITGDKEDADTMVTVEMIPDPDGSYDTHVVDAETGKVLKELDTGTTDTLGVEIYTKADVNWDENYSLYAPPGSEYYIVIDENGVPVDTIPIPEEPEWSFLGIVEYYEDGEVVVDLGATQVSVDVVGPDGGISVEMDLLFGEATAGVTWDEDGSWQFDASVDADIGIVDLEADLGVGQDADGMWHVDIETSLEMNVGVMALEGGQHFHFQETPEGSEWNVGWEGKVSGYGLYVERSQDLTVVFDEDGATATYQDMVGAGISGFGGFQLTNETQVHTDGTLRGTEATQGLYGAVVDRDGNEEIGGGTYYNSETGPMSRSEQLDTGRDYERQYDDDLPPVVTDDPGALGQAETDRFGLADGGDDEDADADDAEGRPRIPRDVFDDLPEDGPRRVERAWKVGADGPDGEGSRDGMPEDGPRRVDGAWKGVAEGPDGGGSRDGMPEDGPRRVEGAVKGVADGPDSEGPGGDAPDGGPRPVDGAWKIGSAVDGGGDTEDGPRRVEGAWKMTAERGAADGARPADAGADQSSGTIGRPDAESITLGFTEFDSPPPDVDQFGSAAGGSPNIDQAPEPTDQPGNVEQFGSTAGGDPNVEQFGSTAGGSPNVEQFESTAGGSPNIDQAPEPADESGDVDQFSSQASGSPNIDQAPELADEPGNMDQFGSTAGGGPNLDQFASTASGSPNIDQVPEPEREPVEGLLSDDITAMPSTAGAADGASPAPEPPDAEADMQAVPDYSISGSDNQWQPEVLGNEPPQQTEPLVPADPQPDHAPVEPVQFEVDMTAGAPDILADPVADAIAPDPIAEPAIELPEPPIEPDHGLDDDQA